MSGVHVTASSSEQRSLPTVNEEKTPLSMTRSSGRTHGIRQPGMSRAAVYRRNVKRYTRHAKLVWATGNADRITSRAEYERVGQRFPDRNTSVARIIPLLLVKSDDKSDESADDILSTDCHSDIRNVETPAAINTVNVDDNSKF